MHVVIFEGTRWPTFAPLSLSRPVFSLRSGMSTLLEKHVRYLQPTRLNLWVRPGMADYCRQHIIPSLPCPTTINQPLDDELALLLSGRTLQIGKFEHPGEPAVSLTDNGAVSAAWVRSPGLSPEDALRRTDEWLALHDLPESGSQGRMASYLWDLLSWNEESLTDDWAHRQATGRVPAAKAAGAYHMVGDENISIGAGASISPGAVLDASSGPIVIADGAVIGANAVLTGPCYIGRGTRVAPLSLIRGGVTIGHDCKVGGEIANSIIMGCTNKAHEGYLGDSFLGEWVNFGAGTTTSNLKNTYGDISVQVGSRSMPTGRRFLGSLVGDHTKTAIGTRLMTGTYVGYGCSLATSGFPPRFVPSFTFLTDKGAERYDTGKAMDVMQAVYARRNREWTGEDEFMMRYAAETAAAVEGS